jgi:hypothetical protein
MDRLVLQVDDLPARIATLNKLAEPLGSHPEKSASSSSAILLRHLLQLLENGGVPLARFYHLCIVAPETLIRITQMLQCVADSANQQLHFSWTEAWKSGHARHYGSRKTNRPF